jgi:hypothetical protein
MNTSWLRFSSVCAIVAGSVLVPLALWRHAASIERDRKQRLEAVAAELAALSEENQRLSNLVGHVNASELSPEGFTELLKLRGEIGLLRQNVAEATNLAARNALLAAALTNSQPSSEPISFPEGQTVLAHWPRDQLGFAGYADPAAALQTTLWAMAQGNTNVLVNSVTPEIRAKMLRQDWNQHGTVEEEIADSARKIADSLQPANGFYVVGERAVAPDQTVLDVFFDGEGRTRKFVMKNVGGEWKFAALGRAGAVDADVHSAFSAWP